MSQFPILRPVPQLYRPAARLRLRPNSAGRYRQQCHEVYAEAHGLALFMEIFSPEGAANGLGVIDVVSSGWFSDRVTLNEHIGLGLYDVLCDQGFTVFAVMTGSMTRFTGDKMLRHVHLAIQHVRRQAAQWGIAPDRLGLTGASAGGHLAALAALTPKSANPRSLDPTERYSSAVQAAALFFPPTDLLDFGSRGLLGLGEIDGVAVDRMLFKEGVSGKSAEAIEAKARALSPVHQPLHQPPPFLLFHGDRDPLVPLSQSEKLAAALRQAGGEATLRIKKGGGHPWPDIKTELEAMGHWFYQQL